MYIIVSVIMAGVHSVVQGSSSGSGSYGDDGGGGGAGVNTPR